VQKGLSRSRKALGRKVVFQTTLSFHKSQLFLETGFCALILILARPRTKFGADRVFTIAVIRERVYFRERKKFPEKALHFAVSMGEYKREICAKLKDTTTCSKVGNIFTGILNNSTLAFGASVTIGNLVSWKDRKLIMNGGLCLQFDDPGHAVIDKSADSDSSNDANQTTESYV